MSDVVLLGLPPLIFAAVCIAAHAAYSSMRARAEAAERRVVSLEDDRQFCAHEQIKHFREENAAVNKALRIRAGLEPISEGKAQADGACEPSPPEVDIDFSTPTSPEIVVQDGQLAEKIIDPYESMGDNAFPTMGGGDEAAFDQARQGFAALDEAHASEGQ